MGKRAQAQAGADGLSELRAVYARIDEMMAPFSCPASAECCRFDRTGREPYLTRLEEEALRGAAAARPRKKLPIAGVGAGCAFLEDSGRCAVYATRPFGCRTFFCADREGPRHFPRAEVNRLAQELLELSTRYHPAQREVRPMRRLFPAGTIR